MGQGATSYPVVVVCPECSAIYTPDVKGINARLARVEVAARELIEATADYTLPSVVRRKLDELETAFDA